MYFNNILGSLRAKIVVITLALCSISPLANATVVLPALDISMFGGDTGVSSDGTTLTMDATAFSIFTGGAPIDIPDVDFTLSATYSSFDGGITYTFINGTLSAGTLLSASFRSMDILSIGGGFGNFNADLTYTGGSMLGSFTGGRIEGQFDTASSGDFSTAFNASGVIAKVGEVAVVPVPAAVWLFASGMLGLVSVARRNRSKNA